MHKCLLYKTLKVNPSTTGPTQWYNTASRSLCNQLFVPNFQNFDRSDPPTWKQSLTSVNPFSRQIQFEILSNLFLLYYFRNTTQTSHHMFQTLCCSTQTTFFFFQNKSKSCKAIHNFNLTCSYM